MIDFPRMVKVLQEWTTHPIDDLARAIREEFNRVRPQETIRPGQTVAVTAGSRGINNIAGILKCIVDELIRIQARPFIVPAMGSHGGATVEGQTSILAHYGITAETMQVPSRQPWQSDRWESPKGTYRFTWTGPPWKPIIFSLSTGSSPHRF